MKHFSFCAALNKLLDASAKQLLSYSAYVQNLMLSLAGFALGELSR